MSHFRYNLTEIEYEFLEKGLRDCEWDQEWSEVGAGTGLSRPGRSIFFRWEELNFLI